jgi:hypothetical protein
MSILNENVTRLKGGGPAVKMLGSRQEVNVLLEVVLHRLSVHAIDASSFLPEEPLEGQRGCGSGLLVIILNLFGHGSLTY